MTSSDRSLAALAVLFEAARAAVVFGLVDPGPSEDCRALRLLPLDYAFLGCPIHELHKLTTRRLCLEAEG